jgi:hypothetical protein
VRIAATLPSYTASGALHWREAVATGATLPFPSLARVLHDYHCLVRVTVIVFSRNQLLDDRRSVVFDYSPTRLCVKSLTPASLTNWVRACR